MDRVLCPRCGRLGFLSHRWVKRRGFVDEFSPYLKYSIPKKRSETLSEAWDFSARAYCRMMNQIVKFPPTGSDDARMANDIYDYWLPLTRHTPEEIKKFESKWLGHKVTYKKIGNTLTLSSLSNDELISRYESLKIQLSSGYRKSIVSEMRIILEEGSARNLQVDPYYSERITTPVPENTGLVTHTALAVLYSAICCAVLRDLCTNSEERWGTNAELIRAIEFGGILVAMTGDERYTMSPIGHLEMMRDKIRYGLGGAASKHATVTPSGKRVRYSTKHIKQLEEKIMNLAVDVVNLTPVYQQFMNLIINSCNSDPNMVAVFHRRFAEYASDILGSHQDRYEYYFIGHYDSGTYQAEKEKFKLGLRRSRPQGRTWCGPLKDMEIAKLTTNPASP